MKFYSPNSGSKQQKERMKDDAKLISDCRQTVAAFGGTLDNLKHFFYCLQSYVMWQSLKNGLETVEKVHWEKKYKNESTEP